MIVEFDPEEFSKMHDILAKDCSINYVIRADHLVLMLTKRVFKAEEIKLLNTHSFTITEITASDYHVKLLAIRPWSVKPTAVTGVICEKCTLVHSGDCPPKT